MKTLKVYFASGFENRLMMQVLVKHYTAYFAAQGIEMENTSRWIYTGHEPNLHKRASMDLDDLAEADLVLAFAPFGYGGTTELTYAMGLGMPCYVLATEEFVEEERPLILGVYHKLQTRRYALLQYVWSDNVELFHASLDVKVANILKEKYPVLTPEAQQLEGLDLDTVEAYVRMDSK